MASISGESRHAIQLITALTQKWRRTEAKEAIENLIYSVSTDELLLLSLELRKIIDNGFEKKSKRKLSELLELELNKRKDPTYSYQKNSTSPATLKQQSHSDYVDLLENLKDHHIFQWTTFYADVVSFITKDLFETHRTSDSWLTDLEYVETIFKDHAQQISKRGVDYSSGNGLSTQIIHAKSIGGFQQFLLILIQLYIKQRDSISTAMEARLVWNITSRIITGVIRGYADTLGWPLLMDKSLSWVHAVGFLTGSDALPLIQEATADGRNSEFFCTIAPTLLAFDLIASQSEGPQLLLPRFSRIIPGSPPVLEVTLTAALGAYPQEIVVHCFFSQVIHNNWDVERTNEISAMTTVACLSPEIKEWTDQSERFNIIDASEVNCDPDHARDYASLIKSNIVNKILKDAETNQDRYLSRNYAKDFPLEDPNHRQMYMVDRYSVKQLLERTSKNTGINLWCSVRRSGKTTAAINLGENTGRSVVIFQTMDHAVHLPQFTIFENKIREALVKGEPLPSNFFESVINECLLSTAFTSNTESKKIFILDEYESFFGFVAAMTKRDSGLRYLVAQPLLSQMVSFSTKNLIIFMGQRPDAHYILSAQNQLSPLVNQYNFPLFEHLASQNDSEFTQLIRRILSPKIPFTSSFVDAVYAETSGHPYLTVNLLIDMCDWLIENNTIESQIELTAIQFSSFTQQRLTSAALYKSTYYSFFLHMLGEYLSEESRDHEPWLYCIANVLKQIAKKHPKVLHCTMVKYGEIADTASFGLSVSRDQLLSSAVMANFLKIENGQIHPAIRLMARLAACAAPRS